jgi:ABC-type polysaccharide/polyol phosphate export permease
MARRDIQSRYQGSYLSFFWAFVQPTITILLLWFVFEVGFRTPAVGNYPFILWLLAGIIPWFCFSEGLSNATTSILEYSYLVKKVVFKVSVIPSSRSSRPLHPSLLHYRHRSGLPRLRPSLRWCNLQVFYYLFAMIVLLVGSPGSPPPWLSLPGMSDNW